MGLVHLNHFDREVTCTYRGETGVDVIELRNADTFHIELSAINRADIL